MVFALKYLNQVTSFQNVKNSLLVTESNIFVAMPANSEKDLQEYGFKNIVLNWSWKKAQYL